LLGVRDKGGINVGSSGWRVNDDTNVNFLWSDVEVVRKGQNKVLVVDDVLESGRGGEFNHEHNIHWFPTVIGVARRRRGESSGRCSEG